MIADGANGRDHRATREEGSEELGISKDTQSGENHFVGGAAHSRSDPTSARVGGTRASRAVQGVRPGDRPTHKADAAGDHLSEAAPRG